MSISLITFYYIFTVMFSEFVGYSVKNGCVTASNR